jgi:superfamily II DNA/RNA helicase
MVFTRTKRRAQSVADELVERGFAAASVHGDLGQGAREQALRAFRSGKVDVLIATDVAARGIDVDGVTHVVNYECTDDEKTYLHRVGRTGRAGASGVAITFVDWADTARWQMINRALGLAFNEPLETYSTSDHVFTGLGIATTVTGSLPSASRTRAGLGAETLEDVGETGKRKPEGDRNRNSGKDGGRPKDGGRAKDGARAKESSHSKGEREPKKSTEAASKAPRQRRRTRSGGAASGAAATPAE